MTPTKINLIVIVIGAIYVIGLLVHHKITEYKQTKIRNDENKEII